MAIDRPGPGPDGDFFGSIDANLADPVLLLGAEVSFQLGVRRTGGNNNKDFDIIGRGTDGAESFRVRVGTNNNGGERLGYVTNDGVDVVFDLPTVFGDDRPADLNNTGYNTGQTGPYDDLGGIGVNAEFPDITLSLGADGFVIDLAHDERNTSAEANAYRTETLPYNGSAMDLATVEFQYRGAGATGLNSGWFLDNVLISGFQEFLQGDFNNDGTLGFADFLILSNNFGEETSNGDYNFDGVVDLADFAELKAAFAMQGTGAATGAASVPEPASVTLGLLAVLMGLSFRKKR